MPAGAPPPLGRMVQAGRPAGAHILEPGCRARDPLRERPGEGSGEVREPAAGPGGAHSGAAAARRGSGSGGFVLRSREEGGGRRRRAQCVSRSAVLDPARAPRRGGGEVRGCGRRRRWRTRFPCARHRLGGLCRRLRRRSAPLKAARAARPPPSARLPLCALAPASPSGPQLRPPGPAHVTRSPAPRTEARAPCPAPAAGCRPPRLAVAHLSARGRARPRRHCRRGPSRPFPSSGLVPVPTLGKARERPRARIGPPGAAGWCCHGNRIAREAVRGSDPVTGAPSAPRDLVWRRGRSRGSTRGAPGAGTRRKVSSRQRCAEAAAGVSSPDWASSCARSQDCSCCSAGSEEGGPRRVPGPRRLGLSVPGVPVPTWLGCPCKALTRGERARGRVPHTGKRLLGNSGLKADSVSSRDKALLPTLSGPRRCTNQALEIS
ncbi:serine/arginine repetitive matrix protein 1-like [Bos taurus]|uniref:serine/arginine repetitive matrix protein 1-like n=1 Tax=Bos taurus TaxID=9913 RepID=UPI0028CBB7E9|nr:serine/arginine repetitive matrix protein 1-like [Bos taurus]